MTALVWLGRVALAVPLAGLLVLLIALIGAARAAPTDPALPAALMGSLTLSAGAVALALPVGLAAALYLELWPRTRASAAADAAITHLAGAPSIALGLLAVVLLGRRASAPAVTLALALVVVPLAAEATRHALRALPAELREGAYALGASRGALIGRLLLPAAAPALGAVALLTLARALAETVAVLTLAALGRGEPPRLLTTQAFAATVRGAEGAGAAPALLALVIAVWLLHAVAAVLTGGRR